MCGFRFSQSTFRHFGPVLASVFLGGALPTLAAVVNVSVVNYAFSPASVTVGVNDRVTWTWAPTDGAIPHTTTSDAAGLWDSGIHTQPFSFSKTFPTAGDFPYHCTLHASLGMTGGVTVQGSQNEAPAIVNQPQSQTVTAGQNVRFSVSATGTAPLSYQWRFNGKNIPGARTSALALNDVKTNDAGRYSVVVSNTAGSLASSDAVLTVQPTITPSFASGTYHGLFYDSAGVEQTSSGSIILTLTAKGKFTGNLRSGSALLPFNGQFDSAGNTTIAVKRPGQNSLAVRLQLGSNDPDHLTGTISDTTFTANLTADRAVFNAISRPALAAGRYTLTIEGSADSATLPHGDGWGTVAVDKTGRIVFAGSLADGTRITQTATLSKEGYWALYVPLYGGQGSVLSWITIADMSGSDLSGNLSWIKPKLPAARFYPDGFNFGTTASGSHYTSPAARQNVLTLSSATVSLDGGGLSSNVMNHIMMGPGNRVTNQSPNKLTLRFAPSTGTFAGRVVDPATQKSIGFSGVVLQRMNVGIGYFLGSNQSGKVVLAGP